MLFRSHPALRHDGWQVALERGPLVYCLEEVDNGADLAALALPHTATLTESYEPGILGGCTVIRGTAVRRGMIASPDRTTEQLYGSNPPRESVPFVAVPFALRSNRDAGEMRVWIAEV